MSCMAAAWTESHSGGCLRTGSGSVSLIKSRVVLPLRIAVRSQVRAYPLRTRLPDVEPGANGRTEGGPPGRYLARELLSSLRLQRIMAMSAGCSPIRPPYLRAPGRSG